MAGKSYIVICSLFASLVPQFSYAQTVVSTCQTISSSGAYILTNDLTAAGDCLVVTVNDVDIDLAGFTITGNGTGNGVVDDGEASVNIQTGISVRNGTIQNFENGINLSTSIRTVVRRMRLVSNTGASPWGYGLTTQAQAFVENSTFTNNTAGLFVGQSSVVTGNTVTGSSSSNGLTIVDCSVVTNNTARGNGNGFVVGAGSTIMNNTARNNTVGLSVFCDNPPLYCNQNLTNVIENTLRSNPGANLVQSEVPGSCRLIDNVIGS